MAHDERDIHYQLGEISATVTGTAQDVKDMRLEVGDLARGLHAVKDEVAKIKAERDRMIPEYDKFVHRVNNHIQTDIAWKSNFEGSVKGMSLSTKIGYAIAAALLPIGGWIAGTLHKYADAPTTAATTASKP